VEPALAQYPPRALRLGKAAQAPQPEVLNLEQSADLAARGVGNDNCVRLGESLQPCREVRCLADDAALLRLAGADKIADDHQPGGDPDACLQAVRRLDFADCVDHSEAGSYCALRIVFVGLRISEIGLL
jgi:hypothetical protein